MFKINLKMGGSEYEGKGKTALEAAVNLPLDYTQIKTKGVMTLTDGKRKSEKFFYLRPLRIFFASKIRRIGFIRQLEDLLK